MTDTELVINALAVYARMTRNAAKSRPNAGPRFKAVRERLRREAEQIDALIGQLETGRKFLA